MKKFFVKKEFKGKKIQEYLKEEQKFSSRSMKKIEVYLNGKRVKVTKKIRFRDVIEVVEKQKGTDIEPIEMNLEILYEDLELLVLNKPANLVVHPTKKKVNKTLANGIVYYFKKIGIEPVPRFYNRLDMNTTGIVIVTKTGYAQAFLQNSKNVEKKYIAVVDGIVKEDSFDIDEKIDISQDGIKRVVAKHGKEAKTSVCVLERNIEENISIVELKLHSGRTHQIRVHLSSIGHSIVGDSLYGGSRKEQRQLLHSYFIRFDNPNTKKRQEIFAPIPEDIKKYKKLINLFDK